MLNPERIRIVHGLINDIPLTSEDKDDGREIFTPAAQFIEMFNSRHLLEDIARTETRPGQETIGNDLHLTRSLLCDGDLKAPCRQFFLEGVDFILYRGKPLDGNAACVCFKTKGHHGDNSLIINQLQGLRGANFGPIRWEMMLVKIVGLFARSAGFQKLMIVPAHLNRYWGSDQSLNARLFFHYDVTARRLGFRREGTDCHYAFDFSEDDAIRQKILEVFSK